MAKKYSLIIENDKIISIEVDGVPYKTPAKIPDKVDRARMKFLADSFSEMEMVIPGKEPVALTKLITRIFLGVAVLMLLIAAISGVSTARMVLNEELATGTVVDYVIFLDQDGYQFYYPVVEFTPPGQSSLTVQLSEGSRPASFAVGQQITVAYNTDNPTNARSKSLSSTIGIWGLTIILGVMGMAFGTATYFIHRYLQPEPVGISFDRMR